jgi:hypothetical protein
LLNLPEIVARLEALDTPVVDRAIIERLFSVGRRHAIQLLHQFGGYQSAQSFLVDRGAFVRQLQALRAGEDFATECGRRERLLERLDEAGRRAPAAAIRIPVTAESLSRTMRRLPEGVHLEPGRLQVDFAGAQELLARLFDLAQAVANDFDAFRTHIESGQPAA